MVAISNELSTRVLKLKGPIVVLGAGGFIGANLFRLLISLRQDVFAVTRRNGDWRLEGLDPAKIICVDLLNKVSLESLFLSLHPMTIFNCAAYGAYPFESDTELTYQTNFILIERLLALLKDAPGACYIHAGSSSEYGSNCAAPIETAFPEPNSAYAVSKLAAAHLIYLFGKEHGLACANLRLYSVFGQFEDSSRLIPNLIRHGVNGEYPQFVDPNISRDFLFIDDACEAFVFAALELKYEDYGKSFNIGTGVKTTIKQVANTATEVFGIKASPSFSSMDNRSWDLAEWYSNSNSAWESMGWRYKTSFSDGLQQTVTWYKNLQDKERYHQLSKKFNFDKNFSVSAVIACYKDEQAIPIMYKRLRDTFLKLKVDYEIIFVNDGSPDASEEVVRGISAKDSRVIGISHSRNFGSQAAFKSGLEIASKNACVLLDGDLQDPPELIEAFVQKWKDGFQVVYGIRIDREGSLFMRYASKLFYRILQYFSYIPIPRDAGDFALMDKEVVEHMLKFAERDLFIRGVRAYIGFKQTGVDYIRPERMFGTSTNNFLKNIGWAKKGILSYSNTPLNILSFAGVAFMFFTLFAAFVQVVLKILNPGIAPSGFTTVLIAIGLFGSLNLFALAIVGEYVAKIFEESKGRPLFIRQSIVKNGQIFSSSELGHLYRHPRS